eukprot:2878023-Lingulodinium_polyedra.AAC.1
MVGPTTLSSSFCLASNSPCSTNWSPSNRSNAAAAYVDVGAEIMGVAATHAGVCAETTGAAATYAD